MNNFPTAILPYSSNKLEDIENKIEELILEHKKLNRNCEIEIVPKPDPHMITFDGYTNIPFIISEKFKLVSANPAANEHSKLIWLKRENLLSLKWAPADIPAAVHLTAEKAQPNAIPFLQTLYINSKLVYLRI